MTLLFRTELAKKARAEAHGKEPPTPAAFVLVNLAILAGVVATNHNPEVFIGLFLLFLGLAEAYKRNHDGLIPREGLMREPRLNTGARSAVPTPA